jgi:hypothetical protein
MKHLLKTLFFCCIAFTTFFAVRSVASTKETTPPVENVLPETPSSIPSGALSRLDDIYACIDTAALDAIVEHFRERGMSFGPQPQLKYFIDYLTTIRPRPGISIKFLATEFVEYMVRIKQEVKDDLIDYYYIFTEQLRNKVFRRLQPFFEKVDAHLSTNAALGRMVLPPTAQPAHKP